MTRAGWLITAALAVAVVGGFVTAARADFYQTTDFRCFWGGARAVVEHVDPYDRASWEGLVGRPTVEANGQLVRICPDRFRYPLWTAVLVAPLGLAPLEAAAVGWAALNIAAVLFGIGWVWRVARATTGGALYAIVVLSSQPFWVLQVNGQLGGLLFGVIALELWLAERGRLGAAGAALATLVAKPQLFAVYLPFRVVSAVVAREPRYLIGAAATGLALVLVSLALVPSWPAAWLGDILGDRAGIHHRLATVWDLAAGLGGGAALALVPVLGVVASVVMLVRRHAPTRPELAALALAVSLFAAPYAWSYDFLALALPWGLTLANAAHAPLGWRPRVGVVVVATLLPWILYATAFQRGDESLSAIIPGATALLLAASIRAAR
jgi:hypothetical protein